MYPLYYPLSEDLAESVRLIRVLHYTYSCYMVLQYRTSYIFLLFSLSLMYKLYEKAFGAVVQPRSGKEG